MGNYIRRHHHQGSTFKFLLRLRCACPLGLGASGDKKSPSVSITGDHAGYMPADTHLFQVFIECTSPCLLWPRLFLLPSSPKCCMGASSSPQSDDVAIFILHTFVTSKELLQCSAEDKRRRGRYRNRVGPICGFTKTGRAAINSGRDPVTQGSAVVSCPTTTVSIGAGYKCNTFCLFHFVSVFRRRY